MDIDIDTQTTFDPLKIFPTWVRASVVKDGQLTQHPCGVYPQAIAVDPVSKLSAIPYNEAEDLGFLKIDFLHLSHYSKFKSRDEIEQLVQLEPDWSLLELASVQAKLFQLAKHGDLLSKVKPKSVLELADCMALIRPGKKQFVGMYTKEKEACRRILYAKDEDTGYSFKKSHAIAYAYVVVLQLHLIERGDL
jgi:DNA polymerase III alpha subunit